MNKTIVLFLFGLFVFQPTQAQVVEDKFLSFTVDPSGVDLYWKDDHGQILKTIQNLKAGFVSRMYLPEKKWEQLDGNFGVMIGVTE
jgi:hypothetical protein